MQIQQHISLRPFNTFHIESVAEWFVSIGSKEDLITLFEEHSPGKIFVLGGGSNILLTENVEGWVVKNDIPGMEEIAEEESHIYVRAGAGENWHRFVLYCIGRNWAGVENLSLIPGSVGASPIQNIGAYGVELKDVFHELEAYDLQEKKVFTFGLNDCRFGYRDSIFKSEYKGRFIILNVTFRLNKIPKFNTSYGAVEQELQKMGVKELTISAISQAVINIRSSRLPDPAVIGNAGSFFKNPTVDTADYERLKTSFPDIVAYPNEDGTVKLAAGWMIEQCGWKGYREADAGCHPLQALVLVNYGNASGSEIFTLGKKIIDSVDQKFGVMLESEVNIL